MSEENLLVVKRFESALSEAKSLETVTEIRDRAEAVRKYAKTAAKGLTLQNKAAELKLNAERKAGQMLRKLKLRGGDRKSAEKEQRITLDSMGITKDQSARWQRAAAISDEAFSNYVHQCNRDQKEITSAAFLRIAAKKKPEASAPPNVMAGVNIASAVASDDVLEDIDELRCHCTLLRKMLVPILAREKSQLQPPVRQHASRLLDELPTMLSKVFLRINTLFGDQKS